MGAISLMMTTALDAIDELGKKSDFVNDGYHFKYDSDTYGVDDVTIRAGDDEFVLAVVWKNLPGYKPSLCNLRHAFDNYGWVTRDREYLEDLVSGLKDCITKDCSQEKRDSYLMKADEFLNSIKEVKTNE